MAADLSQLTTEALQAKLKAAQTLQRTVFAIFGIIILAWLVLGYWRTNAMLFIVTLVVAGGAGATASAAHAGIRAELARRGPAA